MLYALADRPIVTGSNLEDANRAARPAHPGRHRHLPARPRPAGASSARRPAVTWGDYMAIILDGRVQGRPPVIQSRIGRTARSPSATRACRRPRPGAHAQGRRAPIPLKSSRSARSAPASEATRSARASRRASSGPAMVILIMLVFYRMSGEAGGGGARAYILFTLGGLSMIQRHASPSRGSRASSCRSASLWTPTC